MARKNRLTFTFFGFILLGIVAGAALGLLASKMLSADSSDRFEARVMLYRIPAKATNRAARDFIATKVVRDGFLDDFISGHGIDTKTQAILRNKLSVVARDASSSNAELRLVGNNVDVLAETLEALATYLIGSLRNIEDTDLQKLLKQLDDEIETANERNFELISDRVKYAQLAAPAEDEVRIATALLERRLEIELARRYALAPLSSAEELALDQRLQKVAEENATLGTRTNRLAFINSKDFQFAESLSRAGARLKKLRQTKQRLVIEFNQDTPLRITGRAKTMFLEAKSPSTLLAAGVGGGLGGLIGAFVWSILRARNDRLTALSIERRLRVPVLSVIAQRLTDFGERKLEPMAYGEPHSLDVAGVQSLNVALEFLNPKEKRPGPVIFAELTGHRHVSHVIANLAVVMAQCGQHVLVINTNRADDRLATLMRDDKMVMQISLSDIRALNSSDDRVLDKPAGSISFSDAVENDPPLPATLSDLSRFARILINAGDAQTARSMLEGYGYGTGVLLCLAESRVSKLRKALAGIFHGVVLCAAPIDESSYAGGSLRGSKNAPKRVNESS